jgi:hypothetical protein
MPMTRTYENKTFDEVQQAFNIACQDILADRPELESVDEFAHDVVEMLKWDSEPKAYKEFCRRTLGYVPGGGA